MCFWSFLIQDAEKRYEEQICKLVLEKQELEWQTVCMISKPFFIFIVPQNASVQSQMNY